MKLSNETREVLKNFASINSNLLVKAGNKIATMSAMRNIVALATIEETFEREFAIYDLNEFLAALSLFKKPVLDFKEKYMMIAEEGSKKSIKYYYTPNDMVTEPKSDLHMPETDVEFVLTHDEFVNIQRAAAVLGVPDLVMNAEVTGEVELPAGTEMVMPGDDAKFTVKLITPIAMAEQLNFAIREGGRTVGAGVVTKIIE